MMSSPGQGRCMNSSLQHRGNTRTRQIAVGAQGHGTNRIAADGRSYESSRRRWWTSHAGFMSGTRQFCKMGLQLTAAGVQSGPLSISTQTSPQQAANGPPPLMASSPSNSSSASVVSVDASVSFEEPSSSASASRLREILQADRPDGIIVHTIDDDEALLHDGPASSRQDLDSEKPDLGSAVVLSDASLSAASSSLGVVLPIPDEKVSVPRVADTTGPVVYASALSSHLIVELPVKVARPEALPAPWVAGAPSSSIRSKSHLPPHPPTPPDTPQTAVRGGLKLKEALMTVSVGLAVQFLCPCPAELAPQAWTLLAVFCTTVLGLILEPLPVGAWALCCLTALALSGATTFQTAFSGILNDSIWLIIIAFFFAKSFETSGLGERIANIFVAAVGHSSLGLAYGLTLAEAIVAPALPSSTARAGGIFMPIIKTLAMGAGSSPSWQRNRLGAFLVHCQCQASSQSASLFMTGAAQNIMSMSIAAQMGVIIPDVWITWLKGAVVPAAIGLLTIPAIVYWMAPPEMKRSPEAPVVAAARLKEMGPPSRNELITIAVLAVAVCMWVFGDKLGLPAVAAAMVALSSLLVTGVLTWRGCLENSSAWDTLIWFAVLMGMCNALAKQGVVGAFASAAQSIVASAQLHWTAAFGALHLTFFMTHYLFASQVGHVGALYGAFLAMMIGSGVPSTLAALTLGYNANLFGTITHYASGPAAVYYSSGYQKINEVLGMGAVLGARSLLTWGVVGMAWWKVLGWW